MSTQSNAWRIAARTLRRAGFGVSGDTVDAVARGSLTDYLDAALRADPDSDPGARATPMPQHAYDRHPLPKNASTAQRQARNKQLTAEMTALSNWWIERMTAVHQPLHEKLTLLWHNHFATSATKVRSAALMGGQNQKLRTLHTRDFHTLAYAMLTDPAMLVWLDGRTNTARSANENLAREFMELFSLGHGGGYTEDDVREGAKALTGWTVGADGSARLQPGRYNSGPKTLFGQRGTFDAADYCNIVLAQPASPGYVTGRLWRQLVGTDPSPAASARVVAAYGPDRDLGAATLAVLTDPEFATTTPSIVTPPADWLIGALRSLKVPVGTDAAARSIASPTRISAVLRSLGQRPFYPPDVGGWPSGQAWLSSSSVSIRAQVATELARAGDLSAVEHAGRTDRVDAVGHLLGIGYWTDATAAALAPLAGSPQQLVAAALNSPEYLTA